MTVVFWIKLSVVQLHDDWCKRKPKSLLRVLCHEILTWAMKMNQLLWSSYSILVAARGNFLPQNSLNFSRTVSGKSWLDCQSSSGYVSKFVESPAWPTLGTIGGCRKKLYEQFLRLSWVGKTFSLQIKTSIPAGAGRDKYNLFMRTCESCKIYLEFSVQYVIPLYLPEPPVFLDISTPVLHRS